MLLAVWPAPSVVFVELVPFSVPLGIAPLGMAPLPEGPPEALALPVDPLAEAVPETTLEETLVDELPLEDAIGEILTDELTLEEAEPMTMPDE